MRPSVAGVLSECLHIAVQGAEFIYNSKATDVIVTSGGYRKAFADLSSFNVLISPLATPKDQVRRTWGSGFSRITGVQHANRTGRQLQEPPLYHHHFTLHLTGIKMERSNNLNYFNERIMSRFWNQTPQRN